MSSITVKLVSRNGSTDVVAARQSFETALAEHVAQHETEMGVVADAVNAVLAENAGKAIKLGTLGSYAAMRLNATPDNHSTLSELAQDYARANAKGDNSALVIIRGAGGGVIRRSDLPVEA